MKHAILVLFTLGLAACGQEPAHLAIDSQGFVSAADFTTVTYANVNATAIQPYCIKCHSGDDPAHHVGLETYGDVFAARKEIAEQVEKGKMPRKMTMDPQAKDLLLKWIAAGAPKT